MLTNDRGSRQEGGENEGSLNEELNRLTLTLVGEVRKTTRTRTSGSVSSESSRRSSMWEESYVFASSTVSFSTRRLGGDIHSKLQDGFEDDLASLACSAGLAVASGARSTIGHEHEHGHRLLSLDEMLKVARQLAATVGLAVEVPAVLINKLLKIIRIRDKNNAWYDKFQRGHWDKSHKVFLQRLDDLADLLIEARASYG
ncbi:hypothetical protein DV737_g2321, partial [Chaetothyriales sp. CBS 132003]